MAGRGPRTNLIMSLQQLERDGWVVVPDALPPERVDALRVAMDQAQELQRPIQIRNGVGEGMEGTIHHLVAHDGEFLRFVEEMPAVDLLEAFLSSPVIINTFGGSTLRRGYKPYVTNIHRDVRTYSRETRVMVQMLVMVDDFTRENGATHVLTGSHLRPERPADGEFFEKADRAVGRAGSVMIFDSQVWHAAGANTTDAPRRCLTLTFTRPSVKQQMDYPRLVGWDRGAAMSPKVQQLLGYLSRTPSTLDEWYQPPERRFYRRGQG